MNSVDLADLLGGVMITISAVLALACVIAYQIKTEGAWNASEVGRHLMAFMGSMAAVLVVSVLRFVFITLAGHDDPVWFFVVRLVVFASVPVVLAWRLKIILTADEKKESDHE